MILLSVRAGDGAPGGAKRLAIDTANESRNRHSGRVLLVACVLLVLVFSRLGIRCCSARACQSLTMAGEGDCPGFWGVWFVGKFRRPEATKFRLLLLNDRQRSPEPAYLARSLASSFR